MARSYEDRGEAERAQEHYEFLLSWDFSYRDAYRRLENLRSGTEPRRSAYEQHLDYTGLARNSKDFAAHDVIITKEAPNYRLE